MSFEARIKELGLTIPPAAKPAAAYIPAVQSGNLVYVSGQLPSENGELVKGTLGKDLGVEDGYRAARLCALNCLGAVKSLVGSLDRVVRIVKVTGYVAATPEFTDHPKVINGASELMQEIFGEQGKHARAAIGMASLPLGVAVEVEMIVEVE
ncbi:MAG TPA: RidA family protein [Firmicutes bacterium]|jgi:enamine deaminase RidA (YjgF/YER057c/UK114 family)|nr:RidA family protein [Bacillota bacterium]